MHTFIETLYVGWIRMNYWSIEREETEPLWGR